MNQISEHTVNQVKAYVEELLDNNLDEGYLYHSKKHTFDVWMNVKKIGKEIKLAKNDQLLAEIAALFHDVGYIHSSKEHEQTSMDYAKKFLSELNIDSKSNNIILEAIMSTRVPQKPKSSVAKVLCDADLLYLSGDNFFEESELLRLEWARLGKENLNKNEFNKNSIEFISSHNFHTTYGKEVLEPLKQRNLLQLINRINQTN